MKDPSTLGDTHPSWVFAYGTLMGDNALRDYKGESARLTAYHRSFNHRSVLRWGTPEHPCPVLGLSPGGECWGVAFAVPRREESAVLRRLSQRESAEEYRRSRAPVEVAGSTVDAWVWLSRPEYRNGGGWSGAAEIERALREAHGIVGTGVEYVRTLIHAMELRGIEDAEIGALWKRLRP